jgi:hypothetical protein
MLPILVVLRTAALPSVSSNVQPMLPSLGLLLLFISIVLSVGLYYEEV